MAYINHNIISDYFKKRPQLKKPNMNQLGFEIPPEWKDFVESLISIADRKTGEYTIEDYEKYWIAKCPSCCWAGLSKDCNGGESIADTGDFEDILCPKCHSSVD